MNSLEKARLGLPDLVNVETCAAFLVPRGSRDNRTEVLIIARGGKPSACHRVDIIPARAQQPVATFAAVAVQEPGFCIPEEQKYAYSEVVTLPRPQDQIVLLSRGPDPSAPHVHQVPVHDFEPNSLQRWQETLNADRFARTVPQVPWRDAVPAPAVPTAPLAGPQLYPRQSFFARLNDDNEGFDPPRPSPPGPRPTPQVRNSGDFHASVSFYAVGYARCEVFVERDNNGVRERWVFRGEGGGPPLGGGFTGVINTNNLERLISSTTSCAVVGATFYGNITFFDAGANVIGNFHGGGFGVGGGGFVGSWQVG